MAGGTQNSTQGVNQNSLRIIEKHLYFPPETAKKSQQAEHIILTISTEPVATRCAVPRNWVTGHNRVSDKPGTSARVRRKDIF